MSASSAGARFPPPGTVVTPLADLPDGVAIAVDVTIESQRWSVIVVRRGAEVRAFDNRCPHAGMPLDRLDGRVTLDPAGFLVCAAHLASFRVEDGAYAGGPKGPGARGLTPAPILVRDGLVVIGP